MRRQMLVVDEGVHDRTSRGVEDAAQCDQRRDREGLTPFIELTDATNHEGNFGPVSMAPV
jgi:hypothetical protein